MKLVDKINVTITSFCNGTGRDVVLSNFFAGSYEMDVFRLTDKGIIYEYEIKISRADFKKDFKKAGKHSLMVTKKCYCNRFYFVTPEDLVHQNEIPDYAGLIYYTDHEAEAGKTNFRNPGSARIVKVAPLIHKEKAGHDIYKSISRKLYFREQNLKHQVRMLKHELLQH